MCVQNTQVNSTSRKVLWQPELSWNKFGGINIMPENSVCTEPNSVCTEQHYTLRWEKIQQYSSAVNNVFSKLLSWWISSGNPWLVYCKDNCSDMFLCDIRLLKRSHLLRQMIMSVIILKSITEVSEFVIFLVMEAKKDNHLYFQVKPQHICVFSPLKILCLKVRFSISFFLDFFFLDHHSHNKSMKRQNIGYSLYTNDFYSTTNKLVRTHCESTTCVTCTVHNPYSMPW